MKTLFRVTSILFLVALVISNVGPAYASDSALELVGAINEASNVGAGQPTNYVFRDITKTFNYSGGPVCLSSSSDHCSPPAIDDAVRIYVDGAEVFYHESYTHDFGPIDFSSKLHVGSNQIRVQLIDLMGPSRGGSALWLVPDSGGGPPVACSRPEDFVGLGIPRRAVGSYEITTVAIIEKEYSIQGYLSRCPAMVSIDLNPFRISSDRGDVTFNEILEPQSSSISINKTFVGYDPDLLLPAPSFGIRHDFDVVVPDRLTFNSEHELKWIFRFRPPAFAYDPAYTAKYYRIAAAVAIAYIAVQSLPVGAVAAFVLLIGGWYQQTTGLPLGDPGQTLNPTSYSYSRMSLPYEPQNLINMGVVIPPSSEVLQALRDSYGPLVDFADVGTLVPSKQVISAYTIFSFDGDGFTPNSDVYVSLNSYESSLPIREGFFTADSFGHLEGSFEMPPPDQTTLGDYVLAAIDLASLDQSLNQLVAGQSTSLSLYMAGVGIEVVEDITPPTISITSPVATTYTRSDHPYVSFEVTDDLSGVALVNSWLDGIVIGNGIQLDMLFWNLGEHTLSVQAFDKVGWEQNQSVTFRLIATLPSLRSTVERLCTENFITKQGICQSLSQKLKSVLSAQQRGQNKTAVNILLAFQNELKAQKGKSVTVQAYDLLMMDSNYVIQALGGK